MSSSHIFLDLPIALLVLYLELRSGLHSAAFFSHHSLGEVAILSANFHFIFCGSCSCEGGVDVVGVVTPLRGGAQVVLHGDQVVELTVLLEVHEEGEVEEDGEGRVEVEGEKVKSKRNAHG